jgi:hypothetical protein
MTLPYIAQAITVTIVGLNMAFRFVYTHKYDKTRRDETRERQDKTIQDKTTTRHDKNRQDKTRQNETRRDKGAEGGTDIVSYVNLKMRDRFMPIVGRKTAMLGRGGFQRRAVLGRGGGTRTKQKYPQICQIRVVALLQAFSHLSFNHLPAHEYIITMSVLASAMGHHFILSAEARLWYLRSLPVI